MNSVPPQFNCPRRLIGLARPYDEWRNGRERWNEDSNWPSALSKPRTCSYCGGAHPDDVIPLLVAGWHLETTDKPYKFYVRPSSSSESAEPTPCVKVYLMHWSQEQVMRADAVMRARRAFAPSSAEPSH